MITIASNTGTEQDIKDAMIANGVQPEEVAAPVVETPPAEDKTKSAAPGEPGEKIPAETGKESAATTEVVKDKSQEKPPEEPVVEPEGAPETKKAKGGFQIKVEKLTKNVDRLQEELEAKTGNETRLRRELEEAQAKLAELKPAEPEQPKELVRPKRPTLKECDFDQEKYDVAAEKYDADLDAYHTAVTKKTVDDARKADNEAREQRDRDAQTAKAIGEFEDRRNKGKAVYDDYDDLMAALPADAETLVNRSRVVADYIQFKSKDPAHLIRFLMKDFLEGEEAEADRFMKMDDFDQLIAVKELEDKLIKESKGKGKTEEVAVEAAPKKAPEVVPPVKKETKRVEALEDPIEPVGNSGAAKGKDLNEQMDAASKAGNTKEFMRLLALQHKEKQAVRV